MGALIEPKGTMFIFDVFEFFLEGLDLISELYETILDLLCAQIHLFVFFYMCLELFEQLVVLLLFES